MQVLGVTGKLVSDHQITRLNAMFHFLVTSDKEAWDGGVEIYSRSRFLEYTPDDIVAKFSKITKEVIEELRQMPCLCAYEGEYEIRVARVKTIEVETGSVRVEVELNTQISPIPFETFSRHKKRFGIHEWEFSRTHWAVKSGDLWQRLRESGLASIAGSGVELPVPAFVEGFAGLSEFPCVRLIEPSPIS
jgi:hypothetical protein